MDNLSNRRRSSRIAVSLKNKERETNERDEPPTHRPKKAKTAKTTSASFAAKGQEKVTGSIEYEPHNEREWVPDRIVSLIIDAATEEPTHYMMRWEATWEPIGIEQHEEYAGQLKKVLMVNTTKSRQLVHWKDSPEPCTTVIEKWPELVAEFDAFGCEHLKCRSCKVHCHEAFTLICGSCQACYHSYCLEEDPKPELGLPGCSDERLKSEWRCRVCVDGERAIEPAIRERDGVFVCVDALLQSVYEVESSAESLILQVDAACQKAEEVTRPLALKFQHTLSLSTPGRSSSVYRRSTDLETPLVQDANLRPLQEAANSNLQCDPQATVQTPPDTATGTLTTHVVTPNTSSAQDTFFEVAERCKNRLHVDKAGKPKKTVANNMVPLFCRWGPKETIEKYKACAACIKGSFSKCSNKLEPYYSTKPGYMCALCGIQTRYDTKNPKYVGCALYNNTCTKCMAVLTASQLSMQWFARLRFVLPDYITTEYLMKHDLPSCFDVTLQRHNQTLTTIRVSWGGDVPAMAPGSVLVRVVLGNSDGMSCDGVQTEELYKRCKASMLARAALFRQILHVCANGVSQTDVTHVTVDCTGDFADANKFTMLTTSEEALFLTFAEERYMTG